jgi:hypothetical protein
MTTHHDVIIRGAGGTATTRGRSVMIGKVADGIGISRSAATASLPVDPATYRWSGRRPTWRTA